MLFAMSDFRWSHPIACRVLIVVIVLSIVLVPTVIYNSNEHDIVITVTDKERINATRNRRGYYCIYGTNANGETEVLKIQDLLVKWQWNSSDKYQKVEKGKTYKFKVCGHRVRVFSDYPNILSIEEVSK